MRKIIAILLCLLMVFSSAFSSFAASSDSKGSTIRLARTDGTVNVKNSSGNSVSMVKDMKLYSGYQVSTAAKSYAYISLDDTKAIKLDASTSVEIRKSGKKLEVLLKSGLIFFNVEEKLEIGETMNIRTNTMVAGITGTSGQIGQKNLILLSGSVSVSTYDGQNAQVDGGHILVVTEEEVPGSAETTEVTEVEAVEERVDIYPIQELTELSGFSLEYIKETPALQERLAEEETFTVEQIEVAVEAASEIRAADEQKAEIEAAKAAEEAAKEAAEAEEKGETKLFVPETGGEISFKSEVINPTFQKEMVAKDVPKTQAAQERGGSAPVTPAPSEPAENTYKVVVEGLLPYNCEMNIPGEWNLGRDDTGFWNYKTTTETLNTLDIEFTGLDPSKEYSLTVNGQATPTDFQPSDGTYDLFASFDSNNEIHLKLTELYKYTIIIEGDMEYGTDYSFAADKSVGWIDNGGGTFTFRATDSGLAVRPLSLHTNWKYFYVFDNGERNGYENVDNVVLSYRLNTGVSNSYTYSMKKAYRHSISTALQSVTTNAAITLGVSSYSTPDNLKFEFITEKQEDTVNMTVSGLDSEKTYLCKINGTSEIKDFGKSGTDGTGSTDRYLVLYVPLIAGKETEVSIIASVDYNVLVEGIPTGMTPVISGAAISGTNWVANDQNADKINDKWDITLYETACETAVFIPLTDDYPGLETLTGTIMRNTSEGLIEEPTTFSVNLDEVNGGFTIPVSLTEEYCDAHISIDAPKKYTYTAKISSLPAIESDGTAIPFCTIYEAKASGDGWKLTDNNVFTKETYSTEDCSLNFELKPSVRSNVYLRTYPGLDRLVCRPATPTGADGTTSVGGTASAGTVGSADSSIDCPINDDDNFAVHISFTHPTDGTEVSKDFSIDYPTPYEHTITFMPDEKSISNLKIAADTVSVFDTNRKDVISCFRVDTDNSSIKLLSYATGISAYEIMCTLIITSSASVGNKEVVINRNYTGYKFDDGKCDFTYKFEVSPGSTEQIPIRLDVSTSQ